MAWMEGHAWLLIAGLAGLIVLIVIVRYAGGFKAKATLPGGSLELEGMGRAMEAAATSAAAAREPVQPGVNAVGERNIAIGGGVRGSTIVTGDPNRVG
jgi:hypothetical protein